MSHLTAIRMAEKLHGTGDVMEEIHLRILGPELLES